MRNKQIKMRNTSVKHRKNPPLFYNEIKRLVGKPVFLQFGSENGVLLANDILNEEGFNNYKIEFSINKPNAADIKIKFNLFLIEKIIENMIILYSSENFIYDKNIIQKWSDLWTRTKLGLIEGLILRPNLINFNSMFYIHHGLSAPEIRCKLSYNKIEDFFYYSKLHKLFLKFKPDAIIATKFREVFVDI